MSHIVGVWRHASHDSVASRFPITPFGCFRLSCWQLSGSFWTICTDRATATAAPAFVFVKVFGYPNHRLSLRLLKRSLPARPQRILGHFPIGNRPKDCRPNDYRNTLASQPLPPECTSHEHLTAYRQMSKPEGGPEVRFEGIALNLLQPRFWGASRLPAILPSPFAVHRIESIMASRHVPFLTGQREGPRSFLRNLQ